MARKSPPGGNKPPQSEQAGKGVLKTGPTNAMSDYHNRGSSAFKIDPRTGAQRNIRSPRVGSAPKSEQSLQKMAQRRLSRG